MQAEPEVHPSQRDRSLPMIVNLRGDEDLVDVFCYDAEQAMEWLGIKRSRLTQISGRELRVGRIRRDRYLRPVYRECDLRDYQEWTRATATHQSSSKAIEQAIDSLDDRFNDLFVVLHERLQQFQVQENLLIQTKFSELQRNVQRSLASLQADLSASLQAQSAQERSHALLQRGQSRMAQGQEQLLGLEQEVQQLLALFHQDLRESLSSISVVRREQQQGLSQSQKLLAELSLQQQELSAQLQLTITQFFASGLERLEALAQDLQAAPPAKALARPPRQRKQARLRPYLGNI